MGKTSVPKDKKKQKRRENKDKTKSAIAVAASLPSTNAGSTGAPAAAMPNTKEKKKRKSKNKAKSAISVVASLSSTSAGSTGAPVVATDVVATDNETDVAEVLQNDPAAGADVVTDDAGSSDDSDSDVAIELDNASTLDGFCSDSEDDDDDDDADGREADAATFRNVIDFDSDGEEARPAAHATGAADVMRPNYWHLHFPGAVRLCGRRRTVRMSVLTIIVCACGA